MKLTFREKLNKFFGFGYVINHNNKEIHRLSDKHINCHHTMMTNKEFVTKKNALKNIEGIYDGCRYCWKEKNTD